MVNSPETQVIGVAVLAIVLPFILAVIKHFTSKPSFTPKDRSYLNDLWAWHNVNDPHTGVKKWYNTNEQHELTKAMVSILREVEFSQKDMTKTLERVAVVLDKLVDKIDYLERG